MNQNIFAQAQLMAQETVIKLVMTELIGRGTFIPLGELNHEQTLTLSPLEDNPEKAIDTLRINNQPVANVPRECILLILQDPASGKAIVTAVVDPIRFSDVSLVFNKPDTTDLTSQ